ncbi:hypothetical protein Pa4123_51820 [Phytohabitans aurantiacus]|uniref:SpoVT-AbrB domain-containing protein n=2 Tax=Phytohabitans aurantiacus TaxID=3016789 RepID=A0ABQ5R213_9ACTN|nr:hypothetical protein Pa4123_51820 [Phytohabitans aurantiacus]
MQGHGGSAARPSTVDGRRRMTLPTALADAAGITGPVVVLRGERAGELLVSTPQAALSRLRRGLARARESHGRHASLGAALTDGLGRPAPAVPAGTPAPLPADGPIVVDTAPLLALLDGDPAGEAVVPLLPRLVTTWAAVDDLLSTLLAAGLSAAGTVPADGAGAVPGHDVVMDVLAALGLRTATIEQSADWAPIRVLEFELRQVGGLAAAERSILALATYLGAPALLGRPVGALPAAVTAPVFDVRDLAPARHRVVPAGTTA